MSQELYKGEREGKKRGCLIPGHVYANEYKVRRDTLIKNVSEMYFCLI